MDDKMIDVITPHLLGDRPNTYTLTKALAEVWLFDLFIGFSFGILPSPMGSILFSVPPDSLSHDENIDISVLIGLLTISGSHHKDTNDVCRCKLALISHNVSLNYPIINFRVNWWRTRKVFPWSSSVPPSCVPCGESSCPDGSTTSTDPLVSSSLWVVVTMHFSHTRIVSHGIRMSSLLWSLLCAFNQATTNSPHVPLWSSSETNDLFL